MDDKGASKGVVADSSKDPVNILNSILQPSGQRQVSENQIMIILTLLAGAQDPLWCRASRPCWPSAPAAASS
jgi:hypothetical protein